MTRRKVARDVGHERLYRGDAQFGRPSPARVWNYWLGGKDNYPVDQEIGRAVVAANPHVPLMARQCRAFLLRAVHYLAADAGLRQFVDIGTGLPGELNTHEVAQAVAPDAKIVYADNDPLVLTHARAILADSTPAGAVGALQADVHQPEALLAAAAATVDLSEPVALLLVGILGHASPDVDDARDIVTRLLAGVAPGSHLVVLDGVDVDPVYRAGVRRQNELGLPYYIRTVEEFTGYFTGCDLLPPGVVPMTDWHPDPADAPAPQHNAYAGVARKP